MDIRVKQMLELLHGRTEDAREAVDMEAITLTLTERYVTALNTLMDAITEGLSDMFQATLIGEARIAETALRDWGLNPDNLVTFEDDEWRTT